MSPQLNFYRDRAAEAGRDAAEAKLDNVRERCLRAEEAWLGMAARVGEDRGDRRRHVGVVDAEGEASQQQLRPRRRDQRVPSVRIAGQRAACERPHDRLHDASLHIRSAIAIAPAVSE